jgi:hypothetical protein
MGAVLSWPGALRRALKAGSPHVPPALSQARAGLGLDLGAGLATVVTGLVYASPLGGGPLRIGIVVGLALALARLALLVALARPTLRVVADEVTAGRLDAAQAASRRLPAYTGTAHLLWLLALVTMVLPM